MVKLFFFLLTLGSMKCGPLNLTNVTVTEEEVVDNGGEGIHQHPEAVAGDLNKFLNAIQSNASSPTQKHPKDLRLSEGVETEAEVSSEIEVKEAEESSEVVVEEVSGEGVEEKKSTGVVEEQFLENMKNYNNLKDALTSLSSDMDQVANDRSEEVNCDNSESDSTECQAAPATPKLLNENEEGESEGLFSSMWNYIMG